MLQERLLACSFLYFYNGVLEKNNRVKIDVLLWNTILCKAHGVSNDFRDFWLFIFIHV